MGKIPLLFDKAQEYGLNVSTGVSSGSLNGVLLGPADPYQLETLTSEQLHHLVELGPRVRPT